MKTSIKTSHKRKNSILAFCKPLGIEPNNIYLFHQALTHTSFANEAKGITVEHNERLEFLGDAVLDIIISDYLFHKFPAMTEGNLTKARAHIVCEQTLACLAGKIHLGDYLLLGKGEDLSGGRKRTSILADALEAIIGAVYIDQGMKTASEFVLTLFIRDLEMIACGSYGRDYKTWFQEVIQKDNDTRIVYEVVGEHGPDHNKVFQVAVYVNEVLHGAGTGKNKKEAEQQAALQALAKLNLINE